MDRPSPGSLREPSPPALAGGVGLFGATALRLQGAASALLGWRPGEFWGATPAELAGALGIDEAGAPADRATLTDLLARFPDEGMK